VEDGKTALLVPPGDPDAMASAASRVLSDAGLAATLTRAGRDAVQRYAWPRVREALLGVYTRAMAHPESPAALAVEGPR
jgi:glycosyltransferase involved in cell wall biosynthesis